MDRIFKNFLFILASASVAIGGAVVFFNIISPLGETAKTIAVLAGFITFMLLLAIGFTLDEYSI